MDLLDELSAEWQKLFDKVGIRKEIEEVFEKIGNFNDVYPSFQNIFSIFKLVEPQNIKVTIIGQDPYYNKNQANGIAFSVFNDVKTPPSLKNIFKELKNDLNINHFQKNDLSGWVKQGVFLINSVWTVEKNKPNSHKNLGWEKIVVKILNEINIINKDIIYCLWGNYAKKLYNSLVCKDEMRSIISAHPSPFSFKKGFENSKPFSKINLMLKDSKKEKIYWEL